MKLTVIALLLTLCFGSATFAQDSLDAKTKKLLDQAAKNGNGLLTEITVSDNVHVQAVLIPRVDAERIFGKEISRNYAVIEVNVGNKSSTAALVIHGVFIDYRYWPLSGVPSSDVTLEGNPNKYQSSSVPNQVASEEYRFVRGQLLDAQTDTVRNRFMRWLTLAGNLAGAFTFSIGEQGIVKGIAAITGVGIPGVATAWPDRTIEQLNRVSDLGFRTNKLVPKESSEVFVCFFPIDRFLTPGFRRLFLKSPALFFAPLQMLVDKSVENDAKSAVDELLKDSKLTFKDLRGALPCFMSITHPDQSQIGYDVCLDQMGLERYKDPGSNEEKLRVIATRDSNGKIVRENNQAKWIDPGFFKFMALEFIGSVSLNRVLVTVDGVMTVNVDSIAARVDQIDFNKVADCGDAGDECFWKDTKAGGGVRTGVIRGSYLKGAELKLAEAAELTITDLKKIDEGSNDNELHFSFKLNAPVKNQTKLHFTMTKPAAGANGKALESNTWELVAAYSPTATRIDTAIVDSVSAPTKVTVTGKGFSAVGLTVSLIPQAGDSVNVTLASVSVTDDTKLEVTLPTGANKLHAGCWQVQVTAGGLTSNVSDGFAVPPVSRLDAAAFTDKFIFVKGKDLIDFGSCGDQQVKFKLLKADNTVLQELKVKDWNNGAPVLERPEKLDGNEQVQALNGTTNREKVTLTVQK